MASKRRRGAHTGAGAGHRTTASSFGTRHAGKPNKLVYPLGNCDAVTNYEQICRVGKGTYGLVYKARHFSTNKIVALKRFPVTALREISVLQSLQHPCIVHLDRVVVGRGSNSVFLVFEFCENDLANIIDNVDHAFSEAEVKCIMMQLLDGLAYCHDNFVVHRDLKMSNILYNGRGDVKIADFGLARLFEVPEGKYTPKVVSLWYRAPELLFGATEYSASIDMWAAGCILAELLLLAPLMPASTEMEQIKAMCKLLGAPNDKIWPGFSELPLAHTIHFEEKYKHNRLRRTFPKLSDQGIDLLNRLLTYNPKTRISASEALAHPYFTEYPTARERKRMPRFSEGVARHTTGGGRRRLQHKPASTSYAADDFSPDGVGAGAGGGASAGTSAFGSVFGGPSAAGGFAAPTLLSSYAVDDDVSFGRDAKKARLDG